MLAIAWYLLKVLLCSGILFGYYWIVLRNKKFHQYNRFYLLTAVALSWLIPLLRFDLTTNKVEPQVVKLLTVVSVGNDYVSSSSGQLQNSWDWTMLAMLAFAFVSVILFARLLFSLIRIKSIINKSIVQKLDDINVVFSNAKGTPFSFFKYIFWNENIQLDSSDGQHILKHELAHVQEKHSADKLFIALSLIAGWYNPFMWFIKKELNMIHEFIADEKAIKDGDTEAFASMILNAAYSHHHYPLSNSFFYSPIKRRLQMITSSKNPRNSYLRKVAILPLFIFTTFVFALHLKSVDGQKIKSKSLTNLDKLGRIDTIDIDLDGGMHTLTTDTQKSDTIPVVDIDLEDLFKKYDEALYGRSNNTSVLKNQAVVLDGSVMTVEEFRKLNVNRSKIIHTKYLAGAVELFTDTSIINKKRNAFDKVFTKVENPPSYIGSIPFASFIQKNIIYPSEALAKKVQGWVVIKFIVDEEGKLSDFKSLSLVGSGLEQEAIRLIKSSGQWKPAIQNGRKVAFEVVQEIEFKIPDQIAQDENFKPAEFPGGVKSWIKYLERNLKVGVLADHGAPAGTYTVNVKFNVSKTGFISNIIAENKPGYGTEEEAIRIIKTGPKWQPAVKNGKSVDSQVTQKVSFHVTED